MNIKKIEQIFRETAYVRMGGTDEERRTADYLQALCEQLGLQARQESFAVPMATIHSATLVADGKEIPCHGYFNAGSGEIEAPLYYLRANDRNSLALCRGKIVLFDGYLGYWRYQDLLENGAVGFISYDGHVNYADRDIDHRELRSYVSKGNKILGVNINVKDAVAMIRNNVETVRISIAQDEYEGNSQNVILDLPGELDETVVLTAHYDSTSLSQGAYDNMSGCVGLLAMAEHFAKAPHRRSLRFIWCGSEERGLLGSKAYCAAHEDELSKIVLNVNLDMIGCTMGKLIGCCTTENKLVTYLSYLGSEIGMPISAYQDVYSSDSTPFADRGVPAVSFARTSPQGTATIHNSYDTRTLLKGSQMQSDITWITEFVTRMANAVYCPVAREIPDNIKDKLDEYLCRKRKPEQK